MNDLTPQEIMAFPMGEGTIGEHIRAAVARGELLERGDGRWQLPPEPDQTSPWLRCNGLQRQAPCSFHTGFVFNIAYQKKQVPFGCRDCYKVVIKPRTLRHLVFIYEFAQKLPFSSKCGIAQNVKGTGSVYGCYFYALSLDDARVIYHKVASLLQQGGVDKEASMMIKRGCTPFEYECGPSKNYQFSPYLEQVERHLYTRFHFEKVKPTLVEKLQRNVATRAVWIQTAYSVGDETYLDFTQGRLLYPAVDTYSPLPEGDAGKGAG